MGPKGCIKLLKPKGRRALQPIEIYARKYYKSKVKEELDQICKENGYDRKARFAHMKRLTKEAFEKGSMQLSKKDKARLAKEAELAKSTGLNPEGKVEIKHIGHDTQVEIPKEGVVCG